MFKVYKKINPENLLGKGKGWEFIAEFNNFEEAHKEASKVCLDIWHEGSENTMYWFSDEKDPNESYKVVIDAQNWFANKTLEQE